MGWIPYSLALKKPTGFGIMGGGHLKVKKACRFCGVRTVKYRGVRPMGIVDGERKRVSSMYDGIRDGLVKSHISRVICHECQKPEVWSYWEVSMDPMMLSSALCC